MGFVRIFVAEVIPMSQFPHDGLTFHYRETGHGTPFFFQHGLGGDVNQPFGLFTPPEGVRLIAFDCRAHGETRPLGDEAKLSLATFADDLVALMDHLGIARAVVGGISMGAAVALNARLRYPDRVMGLVLSRAAWLDAPNQANARIYALIARLIREHGAREGLARFVATGEYAGFLGQSPDAAKSLIGQFEHPRAEETVAKLERIPRDTPCIDRDAWRAITEPTLVLANRQDPIHPFEFGQVIAGLIPGCEFAELTPKSVSVERHAADVQTALDGFLRRHFLTDSETN
jgi:pimeloyl-ACP methyl ester carboxylesterase